MKEVSGREFARILEKNGWKLARIRGSHHVYIKEGRTERISLFSLMRSLGGYMARGISCPSAVRKTSLSYSSTDLPKWDICQALRCCDSIVT
jgi:hypothetical protein